jgi:hypothetical protein
MKLKYLFSCLISGAILLTGCGGDTGSNAKPEAQTTQFYGYISQSSNSTLTVTDGSKVVTVDTGSVPIVSDSGGNPNNLVVGMMVTVDTNASGDATMITYDSDVEGVVVSNDITADNSGSMNVMEQIVIVDDMTVYDAGIDHASNIAVGTAIEVSGIMQDDGSILAKYIELKSDSDHEYEIKGIVSGIPDPATDITTFNIGDCQINIDENTTFDGLTSAADLVNGIKVEVKANTSCPVTAAKIERGTT